MLDSSVLLAELTLGLVASVAGDVTKGALDLASSRVDVGLESGRLFAGHCE